MIRIFTDNEPKAITLTVDGQLLDDCVETVENHTDHALAKGRPVHLFLRDVSHIGERGRAMLSRLASRGVRLSASGIYSSFIVAEVSRERMQQSTRANSRAERRREVS